MDTKSGGGISVTPDYNTFPLADKLKSYNFGMTTELLVSRLLMALKLNY